MLRNSLIVVSVTVAFAMANTVEAAPSFSRGTAIKGVIAYQDASDPSQFWYFPTQADELLGQRLRDFHVQHFGIGPAFFVQDSHGNYRSRSGAIVAGTFAYDIGDDTRKRLVDELKKVFDISAPKLLPLPLRSVQIKSVLLDQVFGQFGTVQQQLPTNFQIGPEVAFAAGSAESLFANALANAQVGFGIQANPTFALNIDAKAEFVGDPWTYNVKCDLSQVWKQVRKRGSASVSYGFFKLGSAEYQSLFQDLNKANVCTFDQVEGSLDTEKYGRQLAELMKEIFTEINNRAVNGQQFFKFEPNPEAPPVGGGGDGGFSVSGFSISVNAGYSESFFSQSTTLQRRVSYTGRLEAPITFSAVMAVACGPNTKKLFADLGNTTEPCITQDKIDEFMQRAKREAGIKAQKLQALTERLARGEINETTYEKIKSVYDQTDFETGSAATGGHAARMVSSAGTKPAPGVLHLMSDSQIKDLEIKASVMQTTRNARGATVKQLRPTPKKKM